MYKQTLYKVVEPVKSNTIKRLNKEIEIIDAKGSSDS